MSFPGCKVKVIAEVDGDPPFGNHREGAIANMGENVVKFCELVSRAMADHEIEGVAMCALTEDGHIKTVAWGITERGGVAAASIAKEYVDAALRFIGGLNDNKSPAIVMSEETEERG